MPPPCGGGLSGLYNLGYTVMITRSAYDTISYYHVRCMTSGFSLVTKGVGWLDTPLSLLGVALDGFHCWLFVGWLFVFGLGDGDAMVMTLLALLRAA